MNSPRPGNLGATRVCPHCKATVLENSAVCPGCRHHLRFNTGNTQVVTDDTYSALDVEGTIRHKVATDPCEYCVVLDVRNERGEQVVRQVVGVGVLQPGESRRLHVAVDMLPVRTARPAQTSASNGASAAPSSSSATVTLKGPAAAPASPQTGAKSFLKPPVPGQSSGPNAASKGGGSAGSGLFRGFRKP
jgi:RNA polymerase subunit RPABC4/transcription elongation factor Spt4